MKYQVITASLCFELEDKVNAALSDGWQLQGGVSVSTHFESRENSRKGYTESETVYTYSQAMTKNG